MKPETWEPMYREGRQDFDDGKSEDNNRYGLGQLMERCAWAGGWHDRRREVVK